ncbi:LacI family transcriptional regulator (plasmid) [Deinococcus sp. KNUC1210]|uniref:LacI family DNA-binding transcriptional regulator n=1 Tax=Deinococcus sp. KNUC1210 TaxID=2917691 RepID=UPI001EEFE6CE|nr:LacI family DNA-binding transcriptional regulator [Deinococcus sp. KNUC1210]ULH17138.1 LacI family transcriptional regulator [Deinococcus sp. KNUC1210]
MTDTEAPSQKPALRGAGIREVARQAGVSIATVSRVFNDAEAVSSDTRERVVALASSLGYEPSPLGRNLVRGRSYLIGLIVPNVSFPLYGAMIHGIEDVLGRQGMSVLLASSHDAAATEVKAAQNILRHAVDGGIVINSMVGLALPTQRQSGWVHVTPEPPGLPCRVELDNEEGGRLAALELLRNDHRHFAYVGARGRESADRERGFGEVLRDAGFGYRRFEGDYSEESGMQAGAALLDGPLDAVFAAGDLMAAGLMRALHMRGVQVPGQVAVVGFDDAAIASLLYPRLTSIRQPGYLMGAAAAQLSLNFIRGRPTEPVIFSPELVARESTGPPSS